MTSNHSPNSSHLEGTTNPVFTLTDEEFKNKTTSNGNGAVREEKFGENGHIPEQKNRRDLSLYKSEMSDPDPEYQCGYGSCKPTWLQLMHNPKCLLACLSLCTITQGMVCNGLVPVSITTLEKRFHLNSTQTGLFSSMYDIAVMIILIPVCHFGNKGHKGRWLGWGMFVFGLGSLICTLPQFTTSRYVYGDDGIKDTCWLNQSSSQSEVGECVGKGSTLRLYLLVLLLGQLLHGFGASPLYTLGITYIDENVSQRASPVYLGLYIASSTIGPAMGFMIGGLFLNIYGDTGKIADLEKTVKDLSGSDDPRWYGAWWIGYLLAACMAFVFCVPVLSFGRRLPGAVEQRKKDLDQANQIGGGSSAASQPGFGTDLKDLPKSCWLLFKNPTWTALLVMQISEAFLLNGFITFVPKLMENVFNLSSSKASLVTGAIVVPGGFAGNVLGGYLIRRFSLKLRGILMLAVATNAICFGLVFSFLIYCPEANFAGVNRGYYGDTPFELGNDQLLSDCNRNCSCSSYYTPVCFETGQFQMSYYSPCTAGCTLPSLENNGSAKLWGGCMCAARLVESAGESLGEIEAVVRSGLCKKSCSSKFYVFLVLFAVLCLSTFTASIPVQQGVLRCVPFSQRTLAMGLSWVFIRLIGSIPGAILFGLAIDRTCTLWKTECGVKQSCVRYSSRQFAHVILGFGVGLKLLNIVSLGVGWKFYKAPPSVDDRGIPRPSSSHVPVIPNGRSSDRVAPLREEYDVAKF